MKALMVPSKRMLASLAIVAVVLMSVGCEGREELSDNTTPIMTPAATPPLAPKESAEEATPLPRPPVTRCPLPEGPLLHPPPPEVPYPSPPAELASGLIVFRVTDFDIGKPLADSRIGLRFIRWSPSGTRIVTDWAIRSANSDGLAVFDARDMLGAVSIQDWIDRLEKCEGPSNVGVDLELQVNGLLLQFQTAMDLRYGALFWVIGSGRPSETGPYVPLPTVDVSRSWLYPVASGCAVPPSSWEAAVEASLWRFRPPDCAGTSGTGAGMGTASEDAAPIPQATKTVPRLPGTRPRVTYTRDPAEYLEKTQSVAPSPHALQAKQAILQAAGTTEGRPVRLPPERVMFVCVGGSGPGAGAFTRPVV